MSQLLALYTALAAQTVTVGEVEVAARDVDALPQAVESGALPLRLLLPFGAGRAGGDELSLYSATGRAASVRWRLTDLLFWQATAQGAGLASTAPKLIEYMAAYVEMIRALTLPGRATVVGLEMVPTAFEWPAGRGYFGVSCTVIIEEVL